VLEIADPASSHAEFIASDDITFTAEFLAKDAALYEWQYRELARQYHDRHSFAILPASQQQSAVRCRNNITDESFTLKELWLTGGLDELVSQCAAPLILEPTRKEISELGQTAQRDGKQMAVHYFAATQQQKEAYQNEVLDLAKKYSGELLFTILDIQEYPTMATAAGLDSGIGISIENLRTGELFPYPEEEISANKLEVFLLEIGKRTVLPRDGPRANMPHDEL
jgi:hypothetical protein